MTHKIFEVKTGQKLKHQLKEQKAIYHVKASNKPDATRMLKTKLSSIGKTSVNIFSCRELSGSEVKNINENKLITSQNFNRRNTPAKGNKSIAVQNDVDWQTINKLEHNKEVDNLEN